jgi:hypothetical protein
MDSVPIVETQGLGQIVDELTSLRDEIRVQLHLAGMDAKDEWARLETRLHALEEQLDGGATKATAKLASELRGSMKRLRARLHREAPADKN